MTTKIKTNTGSMIAVADDGTVTVDNVVISFEQNRTETANIEKAMVYALKKIANMTFGDRGYTTTDSRAIRRLVLDALKNIGEKATVA